MRIAAPPLVSATPDPAATVEMVFAVPAPGAYVFTLNFWAPGTDPSAVGADYVGVDGAPRSWTVTPIDGASSSPAPGVDRLRLRA
jgi:hypothetical protein